MVLKFGKLMGIHERAGKALPCEAEHSSESAQRKTRMGPGRREARGFIFADVI